MSFRNEPILELRRAPAREALLAALRGAGRQAAAPGSGADRGRGGADAGLDSTDPGAPQRLVAQAGSAGAADAQAAVERARRGFEEWAVRPAAERARVLSGAAARLRERRLELAALQVRECAKPWPEADADVCEAIDFLEYYALQAIELEGGRELLQVPGERNAMRFAPRGVAAVIAPWNFPLAIPCGMTAAALAGGQRGRAQARRAVARQRRARSWRRCTAPACRPTPWRCCRATARPAPRWCAIRGVHVIAFTGSSAVGLEILRAAAETPEGQGHVKRVVSEMGGKNCVIVDADADLDEAVPAIVGSAFGYAGQKCSAAARVLVHEAVADTLVERLAGATEVLRVGQADGARHRRAAGDRARGAGARAPLRGARRARGPACAAGRPSVPDERLVLRAGGRGGPAAAESAVNREEIFGPLLSVTAVADVDEACDDRRLAAVRAHRRALLPRPGDRRASGRAPAGRQPLRQPRDHRGDGGPPAVRRQPPLGHRGQGRRPRLRVAIHRAACSYREHDAPRDTRRHEAGKEAA